MGMLLKNIKDIESLRKAVQKCEGDVILRSVDGREEFNLKSTLSQYLGIARLCEENGDNYEVFCMHKADEQFMLSFFNNLANN